MSASPRRIVACLYGTVEGDGAGGVVATLPGDLKVWIQRADWKARRMATRAERGPDLTPRQISNITAVRLLRGLTVARKETRL